MKKLIGLLAVIFIVDSSYVFAEWTSCKVGKIGPGGGYIFFCDDLNHKKLLGGKIGLEAAPSDQKGALYWDNGDWNKKLATETAVGTGLKNTRSIIASQGICKNAESYAALSCYSRPAVGGDSDNNWFLPSRDELNLMYENLAKKNNLGNFAHDFYWSSSEYDDLFAWSQNFFIDFFGLQINDGKDSRSSVRCVRAF